MAKRKVTSGEVAERSKALVLKTSVARATVGSNPTLSATCGALAQMGERLLCTQEVTGSIPVGSTKRFRAISSVGRAPRLHRGGRRFEPVIAHHFRASGGIGRRAGLRSQCLTTSGFESREAHQINKECDNAQVF